MATIDPVETEWTTARGEVIKLCDMDDNHLNNVLRWVNQRASEYSIAIRSDIRAEVKRRHLSWIHQPEKVVEKEEVMAGPILQPLMDGAVMDDDSRQQEVLHEHTSDRPKRSGGERIVEEDSIEGAPIPESPSDFARDLIDTQERWREREAFERYEQRRTFSSPGIGSGIGQAIGSGFVQQENSDSLRALSIRAGQAVPGVQQEAKGTDF